MGRAGMKAKGEDAFRVAFLWHMHQPFYGWPGRPHLMLPWVRLHAAKSYSDMAWMLERHPGVRMTVNFSGVLVRQIRMYAESDVRDDFWFLTLAEPDDLRDADREFMVQQFFSCHWDRLVRTHERYAELLRLRQTGGWRSFARQDFVDLQVLFNLQWCGQWMRATVPAIASLVARRRNYRDEDRAVLLAAQLDVLRGLGKRWQALVERGQVEVSTTPMYHPILPLVVDSDIARRCLPDHPMPQRFVGDGDADLHVERALSEVERWIGVRPVGMWPAEGSVSPEVVPIFARHGVRWIASDEEVLHRSRHDSVSGAAHLRAWIAGSPEGAVQMLFRDHSISDAVGFSYAQRSAKDAAQDFVERIQDRRDSCAKKNGGCLAVILDGENPWEAYPEDGVPFLDSLYQHLQTSSWCRTATMAEIAASATAMLHHLHSGSWINADFRIWIGVDAKNRGWDLLARTRDMVRLKESQGVVVPEAAREALMMAEGSDWFWWYGDDFESQNDAQFDQIFKAQCAVVWDLLGEPMPQSVHVADVSQVARSHELLLPTRTIQPRIDGRVSDFYEWHGAGVYFPRSGSGAMYRAHRLLQRLLYGYDEATLWLRLDSDVREGPIERVELTAWSPGGELCGKCEFLRSQATGEGRSDRPWASCDEIVEIGVPWRWLGATSGECIELVIVISGPASVSERLPSQGRLQLRLGERSWTDWLV
jgi:alpha-amylase/alpha-mannosidase (GH57 family)